MAENDSDQYKTGDGNKGYLQEGEKKLKDILKHLGNDEDVTPKEYEDFVMALTGNNGFPDKETVAAVDDKVKAVLNIGLKDGDMKDEVINVTATNIPVMKLIPTQSQIGLLDSIGFLAFLCAPGKIDKEGESLDQLVKITSYLSSTPDLGGSIVTANGKYIIDGHHRWSGLYMVNPAASIPCFDLDMNNFKDQEKMLATVQLAVASTYGALYMKNANAETDIFNYGGSMTDLVTKVLKGEFGTKGGDWGNVLTFVQILGSALTNKKIDSDEMLAYADSHKFSGGETMPEECRLELENLLESYPEVISTLSKNAESILSKKPADAPKRVAMPQPKDTAGKTGGQKSDMPAEVEDRLKSGALNFKDPMTIESKKWIKTFEQFKAKR